LKQLGTNPFFLKAMARRRALALLGGAGLTAIGSQTSQLARAASIMCSTSTPQVTEGPYWVDEKLFRSDVRSDPSTGVVQSGVPLSLTITVIDSATGSCVPLTGAWADIWHCNAVGIYSDESSYNPGGGTGVVTTTGQRFLRGYQITDSNGQVQFTTIYPGWYMGRTIHIHVRIRTWSDSSDTATLSNYVTQIFFDDAITNLVLANSTYARTTARDTTNSNDGVYNGATNKELMLATLTESGSGYAATITIDASLLTATSSFPAITGAGIVNAASGAAGLAPGAWISIFGTDLAAAPYTAQSSDVVDGYLPTQLQNVSVQIDGKAAFVDYVSPTQINALVPADSNTGSVSVSVSNSAGMSNSVSANLQTYLPGLFAQSGFVLAVRPSDSTIINGTGASVSGYLTAASARPGDVLEIFGTGFGPTENGTSPGLVFTGTDAASSPVTVTVGGQPATVLWAGLVAAGLWQVNVQLPGTLAPGSQAVVASVNGRNSQNGTILSVAAA